MKAKQNKCSALNVACRFYEGKMQAGDKVQLVRDPANRNTRNDAVAVRNKKGLKVETSLP